MEAREGDHEERMSMLYGNLGRKDEGKGSKDNQSLKKD